MHANTTHLGSLHRSHPTRLHFVDLLLPGPKLLIMTLLALPAAIVGLTGTTAAERISGLVAAAWLALVPAALFTLRAALALPLVAGAFLVFTVLALPFNSPAFVIDFWTSVLMLLLSLPHR